jgi:dihydrofolate reductase
MSVSLDGFVAAPNDHPGQALGDGGQRLHEWIFDPAGRAYLANAVKRTGAVVMGRRTYELSEGPHAWGEPGPSGYTPCFVLTHQPPPKNAHPAFTFVTDGVESAIARATAAAGGKDVGVMGASTGRQCLNAGLLDEVLLHLVPVLLRDGIRLFDQIGSEHIELECTQVIESVGVTHLGFRFIT